MASYDHPFFDWMDSRNHHSSRTTCWLGVDKNESDAILVRRLLTALDRPRLQCSRSPDSQGVNETVALGGESRYRLDSRYCNSSCLAKAIVFTPYIFYIEPISLLQRLLFPHGDGLALADASCCDFACRDVCVPWHGWAAMARYAYIKAEFQ